MIQCIFENGNKASKRHVTVGAISINSKKEVLLVKRAPQLTRGNTYTIPGGFLDRNEDIEAAALRELYEETGFFGKIQFLFRINDSPKRPKEDRQNVDFIYIVEITHGKKILSNEVTSIEWFSEQNLPAEKDFAFDHKESIELYFKYLKNPFPLPIFGATL